MVEQTWLGMSNRLDPDSGPHALEANAQRIASTPLSHPIGEFEYSNANYDVLGYLVERGSRRETGARRCSPGRT